MNRRHFLALSAHAAWAQAVSLPMWGSFITRNMKEEQQFDAIIVGGSYSGLAAGMALGRAMRRVLIVDSGLPANRHTPISHNFITQDGIPPHTIAAKARAQVERYPTVEFLSERAIDARPTGSGYYLHMDSGAVYSAKKLVFATGIRDVLPAIPGFPECWGISVLHCPYCHGYEVRDEVTGVIGNGEKGFELVRLISNWTKVLTLYTHGRSTLTKEQVAALSAHQIAIVEGEVAELSHEHGQLHGIRFKDGSAHSLHALYAMPAFEQHCPIPQELGCAMTEDGYIQVDGLQRTSVPGIYACGDSTARLRTVANAVSAGTTAGMMLNKELVVEEF